VRDRILSAPRPSTRDRVDAAERGSGEALGDRPLSVDLSVLRLAFLHRGAGAQGPTGDAACAARAGGIVTLKNRTLGPAARLFIDTAREVATSLAKKK